MVKAVSLLSGGLDSILAIRIIQEQKVNIVAVHFSIPFTSKKDKNYNLSKKLSDELGIHLELIKIKKEYLSIVKNPKYGYGSNFNPCIDCRIFMVKKAKEYMNKIKASFLITGEVLGQRPMSQRKDVLTIIEKESKMQGLILRPLSAKLLKPTIPEEKGWVDRSKLLNISGRSRKKQIELANNFNIKDYLTPAGGCLLTDPAFSRKMADLLKFKGDFGLHEIELLKVGRHFRLNSESKLIIGRNESENSKLLKLAKIEDLIFSPIRVKCPVAIGRGDFNKENKTLACKIIAKYCKDSSFQTIKLHCGKNTVDNTITVLPIESKEIKKYRI